MRFLRKQGQSVSSEYAVVIILVVAAVSMMGIYVKRTLQARMFDADRKMIVTAYNAAQINGKTVEMHFEYEPYYAVTATNASQSASDNSRVVEDGGYEQITDTRREANSESWQLPPCHYTGECDASQYLIEESNVNWEELDGLQNNPDSMTQGMEDDYDPGCSTLPPEPIGGSDTVLPSDGSRWDDAE